MYQFEKHFSLQEARMCIPELKLQMAQIRKWTLQLKEIGFDVNRGNYLPGWHPDTLDEFPEMFYDLIDIVDNINEKGIQVKSLELGLVDFPAVRPNGQEVFLCWKIDEDDIEFWHPIETGFKGREHIDDF